MERRAFLALCWGGLLALPLDARAQQSGKVYTIGYLTRSPNPVSPIFRQALRDLGWIEGKNVAIIRH